MRKNVDVQRTMPFIKVMYQNYVNFRYGKWTIKKENRKYLTAPSIKDHKHARRLRKSMLTVGRT